MAALIALAALGLFAAGATAGIIGVVSVAIRWEEKNLTLTSAAPCDPGSTLAERGVGARSAARRCRPGGGPCLARQQASPGTSPASWPARRSGRSALVSKPQDQGRRVSSPVSLPAGLVPPDNGSV
jgi:hypothetical protein